MNTPQTPTAEPLRSTEWLGVGTQLLLEWGSSCCGGEIIAVGNGRYCVKMDWGWREIMTPQDLERRNYIVLQPKPKRLKTWLQKLLTPSHD